MAKLSCALRACAARFSDAPSSRSVATVAARLGAATGAPSSAASDVIVDVDAATAATAAAAANTCAAAPSARLRTAGFTLVETLVTLIVVLIFMGAVTVGINMAFKSYSAILFESNSETVAATLSSELNNILRHATDVQAGGDGAVTGFTNQHTVDLTQDGKTKSYYEYDIHGGTVAVKEIDGAKVLAYTRYAGDSSPTPLVSSGYLKNISVSAFSLTYDADACVFTYSYTLTSGSRSRTYDGYAVSALSAKY